jgi:transcriptional regulator with XRE-family HTH domain
MSLNSRTEASFLEVKMTDYRKYFGTLHRTLRRTHRLTQQAVSELLGETIKNTQVSRYESGTNLPRHRAAVEALADAMGCTVAEKRQLVAAYARARAQRDGTDGLLAA